MTTHRGLLGLIAAVALIASLLASAPAGAADTFADEVRIVGVAQVIEGFERHGSESGTYTPEGSGYDGQGRGWFNKASGQGYTTSIASVLVDGGYLAPGNWDNDSGSTVGDFASYQCQDRVAVFSQADNIAPTAADTKWWADNGCNHYPINTLGLTYFQLSEPISPMCNGIAVTPTTVNAAGEIVGTPGDDVIIGTDGDDVIRGFGGDDIICGLGGDDWIRGDSGNDIILPGAGLNTVRGGAGDDWAVEAPDEEINNDLRGGSGTDYVISSLTWGVSDPSECAPCFPIVRLM